MRIFDKIARKFLTDKNENCRYAKSPDLGDCEKCAKEYNMSLLNCCLEWCGEFEFCKGCKNGIYLNKWEIKNGKRI